MNREIKFRAWDADPYEGLYEELSDRMLSWDRLNELDKDGIIHLFDILTGKEKHITPMQFTGLLDKNGKEIYECDYVRHFESKTIGLVKWHCSCFMAEWLNTDVYSDLLGFYNYKRGTPSNDGDFEVIGNIYENPELLNQKIK